MILTGGGAGICPITPIPMGLQGYSIPELKSSISSATLYVKPLQSDLKLDYYRRYVDNTLTVMPYFLNTLNHAHSAASFTMEIKKHGTLPFLSTQLLNRAPQYETKVYVNLQILVYFSTASVMLTTRINKAY